MPIATSDLHLKLSLKTGVAGDAAAQPDPNASLGRYVSTTDLADGVLNNLFGDVSGDQNSALQVDYRCLFVHNAHATLTLRGALLWLAAATPGGTTVSLAVDAAPASPVGAASPQADSVAAATTAPAAVGAFASPTTKQAGLPLGDIPPGQCRAFWVRRAAHDTPPLDESVTVRVEGDTSA